MRWDYYGVSVSSFLSDTSKPVIKNPGGASDLKVKVYWPWNKFINISYYKFINSLIEIVSHFFTNL